MENTPNLQSQRYALRRHSRQLLRRPSDLSCHLARLQVASELPGTEPTQGVLADLFCVFGAEYASSKAQALKLVRPQLSSYVAAWFESLVNAAAVPRISPLATRWSVLAVASADISTRARRCSADDSKMLAKDVLTAVQAGDAQAQQVFLHHCLTCHDNLAFMLARRALLKLGQTLPEGWEAVSSQLESTHPSA
jgi:hypothetical protein